MERERVHGTGGIGRRIRTAVAFTALVVAAAGTAYGVDIGGRHHAGPVGDGTAYTPAGWRVAPVGRQTALGSLPTASALSPDGRLLLVLDAGDAPKESLQVVDTATSTVVQRFDYASPDGVYGGVAFAPDGRHAYASGGGSGTVHVYSVGPDDRLTQAPDIALPTANPAGRKVTMYPAGLAVTPDGSRLVVADQLADAVTVVALSEVTGPRAAAPPTTWTVPVGHDPYDVALSPDGRLAYVSNQGADTVSVLALTDASPLPVRTVTVGTHPNRMTVDPRTGTLYVANSESDSVSVVHAGGRAPARTFGLAPWRGAPVGSNPDGLSLSPDRRRLYVADSGDNDVAVLDAADGRMLGLIPTAWYPTAVTPSRDGRSLYVVNAKGLGASPNPQGPDPYTDAVRRASAHWIGQYSGTMIVGSLSTVPTPDAATLADWSRTVVRDDGFGRFDGFGRADRSGAPGTPVPMRVGERSPITHVIYVVRENRTYDQVFGSLGKGDGDPALNLFGDDSAPNSRALQRTFVTLDNFYANAEVSAQGWNWSVGANSNPYVEQTWVGDYSGRHHPYEYEGGSPAAAMNRDPLDAYIWDRLADRGVPFRNYGFYETGRVFNSGSSGPDPRLVAHSDPDFTGWDITCPDSGGTWPSRNPACTPRIDEWQREFTGYVAHHDLPTVTLLRLPGDHTATTAPGMPTPTAYIADNDYALGRLVDTVSHSPYWASTAIFVVEDDAQDGPDHVDAHRTEAQLISPYTQTGRVDSTFYSTVSMLRTIELLAGIGPMTQFDALATPMSAAFTDQPNLTPYTAVKPSAAVLGGVNPATGPLAREAAGEDLSHEDQLDERQANEEIWASVKGLDSPMPGSGPDGGPDGGTSSPDGDG
ncbi:bifunctional YncE family protein/alkaline phosphatase family protein [Streptacidiphilus sp. MAP5-3]|uniref:bifunctional YncE family protein/alkaline phosphatase family protein n=1 Tax=unclassified Streptacidiphilus TaxID=2643834 RepID=UPI003513287D